jgi:nicotinamide riboside kinase
MNITLPFDLGMKLKKTRNRSAFIADSVREKLEREERERFVKELQAAYAQSSSDEKALNEDWDAASGDHW